MILPFCGSRHCKSIIQASGLKTGPIIARRILAQSSGIWPPGIGRERPRGTEQKLGATVIICGEPGLLTLHWGWGSETTMGQNLLSLRLTVDLTSWRQAKCLLLWTREGRGFHCCLPHIRLRGVALIGHSAVLALQDSRDFNPFKFHHSMAQFLTCSPATHMSRRFDLLICSIRRTRRRIGTSIISRTRNSGMVVIRASPTAGLRPFCQQYIVLAESRHRFEQRVFAGLRLVRAGLLPYSARFGYEKDHQERS